MAASSSKPAMDPHTKATLLFDRKFLTTAHPQLTVSGGKGARIEIGYAEALWLPGFQDKGNRNAIETHDEGLVIDDLRGVYTGYPFERKARFDAGSPELDKILEVGWRTARRCAHETYMDCRCYEQLQYAGDTRVQSLVSLYMTADGRLARNSL